MLLLVIPLPATDTTYNIQSTYLLSKQMSNQNSECVVFQYLNELLQELKFVNCNITQPLPKQLIARWMQSNRNLYKSMIHLISEQKKKCYDCCYRLTIGTGKEIIKQLKELKDTVYVFKDEVYNFNFIQMRLKLCLKVSKFTKEMHQKKVCKFQINSISKIPYEQRNPLLNKYLPQKLVKREEQIMIQERLEQIDLEISLQKPDMPQQQDIEYEAFFQGLEEVQQGKRKKLKIQE